MIIPKHRTLINKGNTYKTVIWMADIYLLDTINYDTSGSQDSIEEGS